MKEKEKNQSWSFGVWPSQNVLGALSEVRRERERCCEGARPGHGARLKQSLCSSDSQRPQPKQEYPRVLPEIPPHAVVSKPTSFGCVSVAPSENGGALRSVHQVTPCKALRSLRPHPVPHLLRESDPGLFAQLFLPYFPCLLNTRSALYPLVPHLPISLSDPICYLSSLSPSFVHRCIIFLKGFFQVLSAVTFLPQLLSSHSQVSSCTHQRFSKYGCQLPSVPWAVSCFSHHV